MEKTQIKHNAIENEVFDTWRKIEEAKKTLKNNGYFVDNLWSTEDVFRVFQMHRGRGTRSLGNGFDKRSNYGANMVCNRFSRRR